MAVAVSAAIRAPMVFTPINADEGGYLAIARAWGHGRVLYRDVWVDRPQGLLVLFRLWDWLSGGHTSSIRLMAMIFGAVLVVSTAIVVRELFGDVEARWAAMICAVASAAPMLEGYIPNGELLSGAVAAAGLAVSTVALSKCHAERWMFIAGTFAGIALSIKQSGFDGLAAMLIWLVIVVLRDPNRRRRTMRCVAALVAGTLPVLGLLVVHAALTGWERWWWAIGGYRYSTLSLFNDPRWVTLRRTARYGGLVLGPALTVGLVGLVARRTHRNRPQTKIRGRDGLLLLWLAAATLAFLLGGGYWRHYWLLVVAPVSALAGAAIPQLRRAAPAFGLVALSPAVIVAAWVYHGPRNDISQRAASDRQAMIDQRVAHWYTTHRQAGDGLYVLCGGPAVYADIHQDPPVPYLWFPEVTVGPNAQHRLLDYFSTTPPTYIVEYRTPQQCDHTGHVAATMDRDYTLAAQVNGIGIYERRRSSNPTNTPP